MADIRINALATTATTPASDDYLALDGAAQGTRKILATNIANNVTDVILGSSGPSVKSSLSARAPRQGLVFDGTGSAYATMGSSIGTSSGTIDIVLDIPSSNPSTARGVFTVGPSTSSANFGNTLSSELRTDGKLWVTLTGATAIDYRRAESSSSLVSLFSGKKIRLTVVRDSSASTITIYANGIVLATTETAGGTAPAWSGSVTGTYFVDGGVSPSENYLGYHSLSGFYNRALSASEVVALYESGAPSGADYNSASNTSIITGANSDFSSDTGYWTKNNGATISGGKANLTGGANSNISRVNLTTLGKRFRMTLTVGTADGTAYVSDGNVTLLATGAVAGFGSTGTKTFEFTVPTSAVTGIQIVSPAGTLVLDDVLLYPLGLLLAPDAAQAGGGLTWYDTSGNAANITLPASGVSWNVPTSGYVTSGSSLNLSAGGTNQNITLTPSGTGITVFNRAASAGNAFQWTNGTVSGSIYLQSTGTPAGAALGTTSNHPLYFFTNSSAAQAVLATNGNVLIGTTTDGGQKLQVNGTAAISSTLTVSGTGTSSFAGPLTQTNTASGVSASFGAATSLNGNGVLEVVGSNGSSRAANQWVVGSNGNSIIYVGSTAGTASSGTAVLSLGAAQISSAIAVNLSSATASTSTTTGALVVSGGVGVAGAANVGTYYGMVDGVTAPAATSGYAKIYVDTADGDLKVIFGDGTIKTIATDT